MITSKKTLASRLLYLPLDLHEKVFLWLTYRGLKPVSEITIIRRKITPRGLLRLKRKNISYSPTTKPSNIRRIKKWIMDAGLEYVSESKQNNSWHVGKDINKLRLSVKVLHEFDYENEILSGTLFGYPKESVAAYAKNRQSKSAERLTPIVYPGEQGTHPLLVDKYFLPYIFYAISGSHLREDVQIAKLWADTIRADVPRLAKWFEGKASKLH